MNGRTPPSRLARWVMGHEAVVYAGPMFVAVPASVAMVALEKLPGLAIGLAAALSMGWLLPAAMWMQGQRERMIWYAPLPASLPAALRARYPHLTAEDASRVERGLRQFFLACYHAGKEGAALPSRAVEGLLRDFSVQAQAYAHWCRWTAGRYVRPTAAVTLGEDAASNDALRRTWYWACQEEGIDPRSPQRLPLLFALDGMLGIVPGFHYIARADPAEPAPACCGTSMSDGAFVGRADDFGGALRQDSSDFGDSS